MIELNAETTKPLFGAFSFVNLYIDFLHYLLYIRASIGDKGMNIENMTLEQIKIDALNYSEKGLEYFARNIEEISCGDRAFGAAYYWASLANNGRFPKMLGTSMNNLEVVFDNGKNLDLGYIADYLFHCDTDEILLYDYEQIEI